MIRTGSTAIERQVFLHHDGPQGYRSHRRLGSFGVIGKADGLPKCPAHCVHRHEVDRGGIGRIFADALQQDEVFQSRPTDHLHCLRNLV